MRSLSVPAPPLASGVNSTTQWLTYISPILKVCHVCRVVMWVWTTMYIAVVFCTHIKSPTTLLHLQREPLWYCTVSEAPTRKCSFIAVMAGTGPSNSPLFLSQLMMDPYYCGMLYYVRVKPVCVCVCVFVYVMCLQLWVWGEVFMIGVATPQVICHTYITKYGSILYNRDGWGLDPLCLYIGKLQFVLSLLLTPQNDSWGQYVCAPNIWLELDH